MIKKIINKLRYEWTMTFERENFVPILLYHATFSNPPKDIEKNLHNITPKVLKEQLLWLKRNYKIVSVDELIEREKQSGLAAVTFDDGYQSVIDEALPVFEELEIPFTIFVNSNSVSGQVFWRDKVRYIVNQQLVGQFENFTQNKFKLDQLSFYQYTKSPRNNSLEVSEAVDQFLVSVGQKLNLKNYCFDDKKDLIAHPLVFYGNHTDRHFVLSSLTDVEQYQEIKKCQDFLESCNLPQASQLFSIPFGKNSDFNQCTLQIAKELGYRRVLLSNGQLNTTDRLRQRDSLLHRYMPQMELLDQRFYYLYKQIEHSKLGLS